MTLYTELSQLLREQAERVEELAKQNELSRSDVERIADFCWKKDEDLYFFDYQKFAKLIQRGEKIEDY